MWCPQRLTGSRLSCLPNGWYLTTCSSVQVCPSFSVKSYSFKFIFNRRIIAFQRCVGFCCTMMWISCQYKYIPSLSSLPSTCPSHLLGHHRAPSWLPCVTWQLPLAICFTHGGVHLPMLPSQFVTPSSPSCVHKSALYVWVSISVLQLVSSVSYLYTPYIYIVRVHVQSCHVWLCDPMDFSLPGSSVHGILQARKLEWLDISSSRGSYWPWDRTRILCVSFIAGRFFYYWAIKEGIYICVCIYIYALIYDTCFYLSDLLHSV